MDKYLSKINGPLGKKYCGLFNIMIVIQFFIIVVTIFSYIVYIISNIQKLVMGGSAKDKRLQSKGVISNLIALFVLIIGFIFSVITHVIVYYQNRIFYNMCMKTLP